jgi:hypothetical protein
MKNSDILRILSPLVFFIFHVLYLVVWSHDPFLNKWIDGSFTFFVALVLCNIIRARVVAQGAQSGAPENTGHDQNGPETNSTP